MGQTASTTQTSSNIPVLPTPEENLSDEDSDIEDQLNLLRSGDQSDVTLICEEKQYMVHTHIIAVRSDVFRAMFSDLKKDRTLRLVDITPNTVEIVLHYFYSGKVSAIPLETVLDVYKAATIYLIVSLENTCKRIVRKKIRESNATTVLTFASENDAYDLKDIAISYLAGRKNYLLSESWRRFCKKYPSLANDVLLAYVRRF